VHSATGRIFRRRLRARPQHHLRPAGEPLWRDHPRCSHRRCCLERQILLHIVPGSGAYGNDIFGLHLYTWAFIAFVLMIIGSAILLLDDRQFVRSEPWSTHLNMLPLAAFMVFVVLAVGNVISTLLICGGGLCPESPSGYRILNDSLSLTQLSQAF
jgi:hypothetical protein